MTDTAADAWYERETARLAWELDQFERHGLPAEVSYEAGRLVVASEVRFRGEPLPVKAIYSDGHPYFPPTVVSERYVLDRHQDPIGKNFCLLEDANEDWRPWFSAAQLIGKSLRRLLSDMEKGTSAVYSGEADMPEPVSAQFPYSDELVVLVGEPFLARDLGATSGTITLLRGPGAIRLLREASGIGVLDPALASCFVEAVATVPGRWVALDRAPRPEALQDGIVAALDAAEDQPLERLERRLRRRRAVPRVTMPVGITFLEEGPSRDEERRTWLFVEIEYRRGHEFRVQRLLRAQALSPNERARRIPELSGLEDIHVVVVGAGSLGAPVAVELAKAGVGELDLFDGDRYDVNNSVRHLLPLAAAGEAKSAAVANVCRALNPFIEVRHHEVNIGDSLRANALLARALESARVVIDTTGVYAVGRYLDQITRRTGSTLIVAGLTSGSYGADVFVVRPGAACFTCFERAQNEGTIPTPPAGERSAITPIGCRHPAFSGAGFEATELAAVASRCIIQAAGAGSYPGTESNWIVLDFRGGPHFREGHLAPIPDCETHS